MRLSSTWRSQSASTWIWTVWAPAYQVDVAVEARAGPAAEVDDRRTEGHVRHEVRVHDVEVDGVRARRLRAPELVGEMAEVRGEERGQDVELHHSMFLMILPETVLGSSSRKTTMRGYL